MDPNDWSDFPMVPVDHPLDQFLGGKLAGQGSAFEAAGQTYNVDPTLLAAVSSFETGHGTSHAATAYNNVTGSMNPANPKQFLRYDSIPDSINDAARNLSQNYLQQGLTTIPAIGARYSPVGASNDQNKTNAQWPSQVAQIYKQLGGTRTDFSPTPQPAPAQGVADGIPIMSGGWDTFPIATQASN